MRLPNHTIAQHVSHVFRLCIIHALNISLIAPQKQS